MKIRNYTKEDAAIVADLYHNAIHSISNQCYTQYQLEAWAPTPPDYKFWDERLAKTRPFICIVENTMAGFIELEDKGYIDCLYTHPQFQRRGVAGFLYDYVEQLALGRKIGELQVDASRVARVFFEKKGFMVVSENQVVRNQQMLTNFRMTKSLNP